LDYALGWNAVAPSGRESTTPLIPQSTWVEDLMFSSRLQLLALVALLSFTINSQRSALAEHSVARIWDEQLLHAISIDTARPTVHARNLFTLSTAMYDAWAAYDSTAQQYVHNEKLTAVDVESARKQAVSYAAYNIILHRFVTGPAGVGPGRAATVADIRAQMNALGFDPDFTSTVGNSPAALGNRIAQAVIQRGLTDGSNEVNRYANPPGFDPINAPLTFDNPGTVMVDPNRWQPLHFLAIESINSERRSSNRRKET
jgi:uncharacterized protein DUF6851